MFSKRISTVVVLLFSIICSYTSLAQNYPAVFDQNTLNGKNGFIVTGLNTRDAIGTELSFVGDINNDGLEDIAINTQYIKPDGLDLQGTTYIIFGSRTPFPSPFDLATLNGTNGFKVVGIAEDERRGKSIGKLGDINGDGIDDIALSSEGEKHMFLYGKNGAFPASMTITDINGTNGFFFNGDGIGEIKGAGDVNGDGYNDVVMGQYAWSGATYILFGKNGNFPLNIDVNYLGDGIKGFILGKVDANISAFYVGAAGDINKDGYDDLIVGIWVGSTEAQKLTYVYFGHAAPFTSPVGLKSVNGTNGFSIKNNSSNFLIPVGTLGDINGDGIDDFFSGNNIIFGSSNPGAFTNNLTVNGTNGFGLTGYTQTSAAIGDINRDGIDDFIVVASSENWIIFGSTQTSPSTFDATTLDGTNGFKIKNLRHSNVGRQVSGNADVNGDGFPDFMLSSSGQGTGSFNTGEHGFVYVVFSGDHFAKPLTMGYPKAVNISYTSFELQVNAAEKGKVYYAVYPGTQSAITTTSTIVSGTGALQHGEISINQISTNANKALTGLSENTKYDVYVYFEDEAGNKGQIYKLDDVTTLVRPSDNLPPVITCPENKTLGCGALPNYVTTISVTDNEDASPTVVQFPAAGTVINSNTVVTITATDNANNTSTCTFTVVLSNSIACPGNQITNATSFALSDYTQGRVVTGFCSGAPVITQTPAPGTIITNDVVVTLTATAGNVTATCSFEITVTGGTTAIESATDVNFIVYPNPAKDMVYIKGGNYDSFEIIDNLGSLVLQGGNDAEINISTLAHGMYVILFYNSNQQVVEMKKVVKN